MEVTEATESLCRLLGVAGLVGMAGMTGTAGANDRPFFGCVGVCCVRGSVPGMADEGVVGCVESFSDGATDV